MSDTVLITGGTGQLGSALVRALLAAGRVPRCLVRDPDRLGLLEDLDVELVAGDVTAPESLVAATKGVSEIYHLAGLVSYEPKDDEKQERVNVGGTRNVLDAAAAAGARRLVFTSSIAVLGYLEDPNAVGDETTPFNWGEKAPTYFRTKREAERLVLSETRLECVAVNPGITFGSHDVHRNAGRTFFQLAAGALPASPPGRTTVANLSDVCAGHLAAMQRGRHGERYVLGGHLLSFLELHRRAAAILGVPAPPRALPAWLVMAIAYLEPTLARLAGRPQRISPPLARMTSKNRQYSSAKAERELGYAPAPLEEGLRECLSWYVETGQLSLPTSAEIR
ncbi:MAG: NAD-dependent epimerase/dehydratase family protein [Alphaproteobacteria bacterium]|nr:NAD-dependent epimerase/dehydratase family protein [Alphaproteobacteria bacterium]